MKCALLLVFLEVCHEYGRGFSESCVKEELLRVRRRTLVKQLEPSVCGRVEPTVSRIYQGYDAERGDYPWMALLSVPIKQPGDKYINYLVCSSAIISRWYILTAAHCFKSAKRQLVGTVKVMVGMVTAEDNNGITLWGNIKNTRSHQKYTKRRDLNYDIAILRLLEPLNFTQYVRPICLPSRHYFAGAKAYIAGWGRIGPDSAKTLQAGELSILGNTRCRAKVQISDNIICADVNENTPHACKGDSGGPLMNYMRGRYHIVGILSSGQQRDKCRNVTLPNIYIRVSRFLDWIYKNIYELDRGLEPHQII